MEDRLNTKKDFLDYTICIFKFLNNVFNRLTTLFWIIVLLLAGYAMYDSYMVFNLANDKSVLKYKPETPEEVINQTTYIPDAIAWITIDDTTIDYPILQGEDNNEYLNKDPEGNFSLSGSIFLDYRNSSDFSDEYSLIYGHHMEHNAMFGALDDFKDEEFFQNHKTAKLITKDNTYNLKIYAVANCTVLDEEIFTPDTKVKVDNFIKNNALYDDETGNTYDRIIALTTCASSPSEARLLVLCGISQ